MHKKERNYIITGFVIILLILISGNVGIMYLLSTDYNSKLAVVNSKLSGINQDLTTETNQRKLLESQTLDNFATLENAFNKKTSALKLDLESQVSDVSIQLEDKSAELESQIASIDVSSSDFSSIIEDVTKAVVSVKTNVGQGSGVIYDSEGYVLTNKHVIDSASQIAVVDYNQKAYPVKIVGTAKDSDLAVLQIISNESFSRLKFASESEIKVGSKVIAIGNPKGLSFTVTEGIISATDRRIDNTGIGYLQTDVSINSGNSGGPLVNSAKRIVGINTFKLTDSEGLGFAIPSSVAENIADQAR